MTVFNDKDLYNFNSVLYHLYQRVKVIIFKIKIRSDINNIFGEVYVSLMQLLYFLRMVAA